MKSRTLPLDLVRQRQRAQPCLVFVRQVLARPIDRRFRQRIEAAGRLGERGLFIVVSLHHRALHILHDLDAFMGVGVVTDHVAEADEMRAIVCARVGQHGFGGLEIGVKIAKNGETHRVVG